MTCFRAQQAEATGWTISACEHCGTAFRLRAKEDDQGTRRFCSRTCWKTATARQARTCEQCGAEYFPKNPKVTEGSGNGRFCSRMCSGLAHRNRTMRTCIHCRSEFEVKTSRLAGNRGWYCSKRCYTDAFCVTRVCQGCGELFPAPLNVVGRGWGTFCSKECTSNQVERECVQCGTAFTAKKSVVDEGRAKYCGDACRHLGRRNRVELNCAECGTAFTLPTSAAETRRCCSRACRAKQQAKDPHMSAVLAEARQKMLTERAVTRPERILYELLDQLVPELAPGIEWQRQMRLLDRWTVDAAIPDLRLVLQADGDYWHGLHDEDRSDPIVSRNMANDAYQDRTLTAAGWRIVRLWESDLVRNLPACAERLTTEIQAQSHR